MFDNRDIGILCQVAYKQKPEATEDELVEETLKLMRVIQKTRNKYNEAVIKARKQRELNSEPF